MGFNKQAQLLQALIEEKYLPSLKEAYSLADFRLKALEAETEDEVPDDGGVLDRGSGDDPHRGTSSG